MSVASRADNLAINRLPPHLLMYCLRFHRILHHALYFNLTVEGAEVYVIKFYPRLALNTWRAF